ncbi:hypothetical protein QJS66_02335 [Kocuria rhizophila]|nr:hypothetical protein QJS66_02335 [Kocuria rhizophila]
MAIRREDGALGCADWTMVCADGPVTVIDATVLGTARERAGAHDTL